MDWRTRLRIAVDAGLGLCIDADSTRRLAVELGVLDDEGEGEAEPSAYQREPLPTSRPVRSEMSKKRALVLKEWLIGYGNSLGLQPHPEAAGVREWLDAIIGKGGDPAKVLIAAKELSEQKWWVGKPYSPPGLRHFAERFESYYVAACERNGVRVNDEERKAAERERRRAQWAADKRREEHQMGATEVAEAAQQLLDSLRVGRHAG